MEKIGIDARFYGSRGKGLGRYAQKLIENLEKIDGGSEEREYYIILKKENFDEYQSKNKNFKKVKADYHWYTFKEQLVFPRFLNSLELDLVHFCHFNVPFFYRRRFIVTVHDLILFHFPTVRNTTLNKAYYFLKLIAYRFVIRSAVSRAEKVLAVSKFTKRDIIKELHVPEEKIELTYEGCDLRCFISAKSDVEILEKYGIMKPYLLYVGNAYPHKNLERLVLAYKKIKKKNRDLQLVLVGGDDFFYRRLKEFVRKESIGNVVFPGYVPDEQLDVLYKNTKLYVFPSLYEGFGLPPLEALARSAPVASSSRTSMPEVLGDSVEYFDPENIESISAVVGRILSKPKEEVFSLSKSLRQIKEFSWKKMAKQTLKQYAESLS